MTITGEETDKADCLCRSSSTVTVALAMTVGNIAAASVLALTLIMSGSVC